MNYRILCQDEGKYVLASSKVFESFQQALRYLDAVDHGRDPLIVKEVDPSFGVEADDGSGFAPNSLRFATLHEAEAYGKNLYGRWLACKAVRVVRYDEPVNYTADEEGSVYSA
jgi:hypothetical protein